MTHLQNNRRTSVLLAAVHGDNTGERTRARRHMSIAGLLGSAAILTLAHAAPLPAQTTQEPLPQDQATQEQPAQEQATQDQATQEQPAQEQATEGQVTEQAQEPAATDQAATDQTATEQTATEQTATDQAATDQAASDGEAAPMPVPGQIVEQPEGTFQVTDLIGAPVNSPDGENIGEVADLLFGEDDKLTGIVISIGGFLGFGDKEIAVEADQVTRMQSEYGEHQVMLNYTLEQLEQAPEYVSLAEQQEAQAEEALRQNAEQPQQPATTVPTPTE